ncbi:MAG: carboxy terminal-processing peptidase [Bacteroidota bacterium]
MACLSFLDTNILLAQTSQTVCEQAYLFEKTLGERHYSPPIINDEFSALLFENFMQELDPNGLYFTQQELIELSAFRKQLDDQIKAKSCNFFKTIEELYSERLNVCLSLLDDVSSQPFSLSDPDSIKLELTTNEYVANDEALKIRWKKWLTYQALDKLFLLDGVTHESSKTALLDREEEARTLVVEKAKCKLEKLASNQSNYEDHIASIFLNAMAGIYDPHTNYFSFEDLARYLEATSEESKSLGLELFEKDDGNIQIIDLTPGGPAWKSNELHKGDVLLKIITDQGDVYDLTCSGIDEVDRILASKGDRIRLTVRNQGGQVKTVTLLKENLDVEENTIESYLLQGARKVGYISLPSFYTDWDSDQAAGCANDVARELIKLNREKIDGLILDLRFNGGGSVIEAMDLAGIFIEQGPLAIGKQRNEAPKSLKDRNRGTIYDGPMVVLVNSFSASASEFVAAALQDYNRAVIVGSQTYGKGSGQVILTADGRHLDEVDLASVLEHGFLKTTTGKLYRLTGKSHQLVGVTPDVKLPDLFQYSTIREASYTSALENDEVYKKVYYTPLDSLPIAKLEERSANRLVDHETFNTISSLSRELPEVLQKQQHGKLKLAHFRDKARKAKNIYDKFDSTEGESSSFYTVKQSYFDGERIGSTSFKENPENPLVQNVQSDIYVEEAYRIIVDLIRFK